MFRFFKFYSLYMNNTGFLASEGACLCEKLPRAVQHVPVNHYNVCELCGMIRRPPTCSSDEDEKMDAERQKILLQRRHAEEAAHMNKAARFKVAVKGKKPQVKSYSRRNLNDNWTRTEGGGLGEAGDGDCPKEASKIGRSQEEPSAPPPSSPSPAPSGSPGEDTTYIRRRLIYDDQFVKKFIPLKGPITDPSGGAISKRSSNIWGAANPHMCRPQGPLCKDKLLGGCSSKPRGKYSESQLASQFHPFDEYEGPSEDAFVVDGARRMLSRPNSLFIEPRPDLPNNRIGNHGSSLGRIWLASYAMPSASPPKIPEPPSVPSTNKSPIPEEIKGEIKESNKNTDTSSSPIYQLTKSEEHPGNSECEDILQDLGLVEFSDEKDETTVIELANDDVFSSNKTMNDEEYSEIESKEWGTPGNIIDLLNTNVSPVEKRPLQAEERNSVMKSLPPKCNQCRRLIRNHAADSNPEKISRDSELELLKLKPGGNQRVCPVHSDTTRRFLYTLGILNNRSEKLETNKVVGEMEKTLEMLVVTRKLTKFYKVYHMSVDFPKLNFVSYVRQLSEVLSKSFVQNQPSMSLLEFKDNALRPENLIFRVFDPSTLQAKNKARAVWPSMRFIHKNALTKVTHAKNFSESDSLEEKRPRVPVPEPKINQDSESERKMILAIVKHFRSIKKPLKKKSRGIKNISKRRNP